MNYFLYFNESLVQIILMQIVNGLIDLFKKNIVHHDIKPENILVNFYGVLEVPIKNLKELLKNKENENLLLNLINNNRNGLNNQFHQFNNNLQNDKNNIINMNGNPINDMSRSMNNLNDSIKNLSIVGNNFRKINNNMNNKTVNVKKNMKINIMNNNNTNNYNFFFRTISLKENGIMARYSFLNILKESTEYKLSNFSFATLKSEIRKRNIRGSPLYMAPELFKFDSKLSEIENKKIDIWALGVLAYELFFGKRPFEGFEEISEMYDNDIYTINSRNRGKRISKEFFYFLNKCLQKDPEKRANIYELLNSDFLIYDNETLEKMDEGQLRHYLEGIIDVDIQENFILYINKDYEEEIKYREINRIWIDILLN